MKSKSDILQCFAARCINSVYDETVTVLTCAKMSKGKMNTKTGMGVAVSTLHASDDPPISDDQKSVFDWCKEGNADVVQRLLKSNNCDVQQLDENVM